MLAIGIQNSAVKTIRSTMFILYGDTESDLLVSDVHSLGRALGAPSQAKDAHALERSDKRGCNYRHSNQPFHYSLPTYRDSHSKPHQKV